MVNEGQGSAKRMGSGESELEPARTGDMSARKLALQQGPVAWNLNPHPGPGDHCRGGHITAFLQGEAARLAALAGAAGRRPLAQLSWLTEVTILYVV